MTVSTSDIDVYVPGRGRDREYWLNYVLKLLVADIAAAGGTLADGDYGDITVSGGGTVFSLDLNLSTIDAPTGAVSFAQQQATNFVVENRTSDPGSPVSGQIWLRTDL